MRKLLLILILLTSSFTCLSENKVTKPVIGLATYYSNSQQNHLMSNGNRFDNKKLTVASLIYPFGTRLRLTRIKGGQSVIVTVTDRGPFSRNKKRIIDVSQETARKLNFINKGICLLKIEVL